MNMVFFLYFIFILWSAVIAAAAILLSRRHMQSPQFYMVMIAACCLPFAVLGLMQNLPQDYLPAVAVDVFMVIPASTAFKAAPLLTQAGSQLSLVMALIYCVIAIGLALRIMMSLLRLWRMGPLKNGLIISPHITDPACLPWPRRAILIPQNLDGEARAAVLAHERAHHKYCDAEVTLALCLLGAIFWLNYPLTRLIKAWRFAIELRADGAAISASHIKRQCYAALLLDHLSQARLMASETNRHREARPCPSMALIPDQKRRTEMRLIAILRPKEANNKRAALTRLMTSAALIISLGGGVGLSALANDEAADNNKAPSENLKPIKTVPPIFPLDCIPEENPPVLPVSKPEHDIHGWVKLGFDINSNGEPFNIKFLESSKACFEANSLAAVKQWRFQPIEPRPDGERTRKAEYMIAYSQRE
jgi:TonB family protein